MENEKKSIVGKIVFICVIVFSLVGVGVLINSRIDADVKNKWKTM